MVGNWLPWANNESRLDSLGRWRHPRDVDKPLCQSTAAVAYLENSSRPANRARRVRPLDSRIQGVPRGTEQPGVKAEMQARTRSHQWHSLLSSGSLLVCCSPNGVNLRLSRIIASFA